MSFFSKLFKPMPFFDAIRAGKAGDVRKHLESGVDPNQEVDGGRAYPLHFAVHAGAEIVKLLIDHGVNVNAKSEDGKTPLHIAAVGGYGDVVHLLVEAGGNVNATDNYGHTPLFDAAAEVSPYDMIYATTVVAPSKGAIQERSGRGSVVSLLRSCGAVPSEADTQTEQAIGSVPETERHNRHMTLAHNQGDFEYHRAVREISMEYPFLHDAYRLLHNKNNLSELERIFVDKFERYEKMLK